LASQNGSWGPAFAKLQLDRRFPHRRARIDAPYLILRRGQLLFKIHNLLDLHQKPAVDLRQVEDFVDGEAGA